MTDQTGPGVLVPIPLGRERVFRNQATDDVLELLCRHPHEEFGVRELREITGHGGETVDTALGVLAQLELLETRREGARKLCSVDRERLQKPDDPYLEIPQEEFRTPIRAFVDRVKAEAGTNLVGMLVFGSVANGTADRTSDIDVQVVVDDDLLDARRKIQAVRERVESDRFGGDRYEFHVLVESVESARQHGAALRDVFSEAVVVYESEALDAVREAVFRGR